MGTPDFGVPSLIKLANDEYFEIVAVITQEDKKVGRKLEMSAPIIKQTALRYNLPVLQPKKIAFITEEIKKLAPDLIIVVAYAQIIPKSIIDIPKYGIINVHGSLLPKYRGSSCIQAPLLNGDEKTGVTIMLMDENLDTGPILAQKEIKINDSDTAKILFEKLSNLGAEILLPTIKNYIDNKIQPQAQDNTKSSYVKMLKKSDGHIDWSRPAVEIERQIRAMYSWPGAYGIIKPDEAHDEEIMLKIITVAHNPININAHKSGTLFMNNNELYIQCGKDALEIYTLQLSGKNIMFAQEFINGYSKYNGQILS